jgi:hypothetical protein
MLTAAQLMARAQLCRLRARAVRGAAGRANLVAFAHKFEKLARSAQTAEAPKKNKAEAG